ncbi:hypothetical protein HK103_003310 [Boothiomyces macroporosus]|uniref:Structural maintenance of chromosomes protein n=1 Tax=Boothiomyces macroporosus TaxID=261099 RepID=A0AAD5ULN9_9FUNG|nr:hypothetical protein HK103_003310 [Boothiomyces macroporosus]
MLGDQNKRLIISKLVLINFKSYAGQVEIGPFHKSFSSVVGPNGSGKSNVIDSLLFVFGFKAKKLRQGKLSDLIHNSAKFPNLKECSVQVHFQEIVEKDHDEIVNSFVVSRTVKKGDGKESSSYHIDGRTSNYTQVQTLLKSYGIDLDHKRFLILQGEVESISLMKPKGQNENEDGLLEYLEDIIGTTSYKQPIEELVGQLDILNNKYDEQLVKFKHIKSETNSLQSKTEEAIKYIQWENKITNLKNTICQLKKLLLTRECLELEMSIAENKIKQNELKKIQESESQENQELETKLKELEQELTFLLQEQKQQNKILSSLEKQEIELKEFEKHSQTRKRKLLKSFSEDKHQKTDIDNFIGNFEQDVSRTNKEIEELKERLGKESQVLQEMQESLSDKTLVYQQEIEQLQVELQPWSEKINDKQSQLDTFNSELDLLDTKINSGKVLLEESNQRLSTLLSNVENQKEEYKLTEKNLQKSEKDLSEKQKLVKQLEATVKTSKQEYIQLQTKHADTLEYLKSFKERGNIYKELMKQKQKGTIQGICGRLGDLGTIDDKFDVAVSTACGALNSFVVETVEAGQMCIEFLKKHNLGRATFICLDKLRKFNLEKITTPEHAPRLFDLIKSEGRYLPAFYQALGDTLVADNLEQANRIAYGKQRYRVVTLTGQLIDKSGTMSGGGNRVERGGMRSSKAPLDQNSIEDLEEKLQEAELVYQRNTKELEQLQDDIQEAQQTVQELQNKKSKLDLDIKSLSDQVEDAKNAVKLALQNSQPEKQDVDRFNELKKIVKKLETELAPIKASAQVIQDKIKKLHETIMEIGGVRLRTQRHKVDSLNEQIEMLQSQVTKMYGEKTAKEKQRLKLVKNIEKKTLEIEEIEKEIEKQQEEYQEKLQETQSIKSKLSELEHSIETKQDEVNELKQEYTEKINSRNKMKSQQLELVTELKQMEQSFNKNKSILKEVEFQKGQLEMLSTGEDKEEHLVTYSENELEQMNLKALVSQLDKLESEKQDSQVNLGVIKEYKAKMAIFTERSNEVERAAGERDAVKAKYNSLRKERLTTFMDGFTKISQYLKEMYQIITMGGNAELELVDSMDPFSEGVLFSVMPPKKSWKNISNLSGGEKTLSSLALVFALHQFKPTPLYVMDEIDAALDFRNVSIVANYIKERTRNGQFIIISLRNNMFELADRLVGIYKTENTSKSITIDPLLVEKAAIQ